MIRKVVIVNDYANINGGQAKVAVASAIGLKKAGLDVTFFCGSGRADPSLEQNAVEVISLNHADILSDPSRLRAAFHGIWNAEAARRLNDTLQDFDPAKTVVHCHGFAKVLSGSIGPIITRHRIPHVYTMHDYSLACPNGGFFDYRAAQICRRHALGVSCLTTNCDARKASHKAWRVARQFALHRFGNMPQGLRDIIYISRAQLNFIQSYLAPTTRIHHVLNPVDAERAKPVDVAANRVFLFVGRLSAEKGAALFAKAAARLGVEAVFVGDGEDRAEVLSALPNATVTGWQTPEEVNGWIRKSRCVVFPSLWAEPFGLVPLEALARGVPAIAGKWTAASERIEHGVNGIIIQEATVDRVASAILQMTSADVGAMGKKAYDMYWTNPLTVDRHVTALLSVYENLTGPRKVG